MATVTAAYGDLRNEFVFMEDLLYPCVDYIYFY